MEIEGLVRQVAQAISGFHRCHMSSDTLPLSELRGLSRVECDRRIDAFLKSSPNGAATSVAREIEQLESSHGMSSSQMLQGLRSGEIKETESVCHWIMLLKLLGRA